MKNNICAYGLVVFLAINFGTTSATFFQNFSNAAALENNIAGAMNGSLHRLISSNVSWNKVYPMANLFAKVVEKGAPGVFSFFSSHFSKASLLNQSFSCGSLNMFFFGFPFAVGKAMLESRMEEKIIKSQSVEYAVFIHKCIEELECKKLLIDVARGAALFACMAIGGAPLSICACHSFISVVIGGLFYTVITDKSVLNPRVDKLLELKTCAQNKFQ